VNAWLLGVAALLYTGVAIDYALKGSPGNALAWAAYALANVGFIIAARTT
jgi:hypothetical protein